MPIAEKYFSKIGDAISKYIHIDDMMVAGNAKLVSSEVFYSDR